MKARGRPVRCYNCTAVGEYRDGTYWSCRRCGKALFTLADRLAWWEKLKLRLGVR